MLIFSTAALAALFGVMPIVGGDAFGVKRAGAVASVLPYRTNTFSADPHWEAFNNRPDPLIPCGVRSFNFGWSNTKNAGGAALGEIGGQFGRSITYRAYYGKPLVPAKTLNDPLIASGTLNVTLPTGSTALFGWFNSQTSRDWRDNDFVGLRINGTGEGTGANDNRLEVFAELGSKNNFAVDDVFVGRDDGVVIPVKLPLKWKIEYLPTATTSSPYGLLKLTLQVKGVTYVRSANLSRIMRADGATLDRFGFISSQLDNDKPMFLYVDDLVLDGVPYTFATDPRWEASNNHLTNAPECAVQRRNNFGWGATAFAGGTAGEIGGLIWHSSKKATYADVTAPLNLRNYMYATGKIVLRQANPDSELLVGWFNSATKDWPLKYGIRNVVAAEVGGISDTGFRLFPNYKTAVGTGKQGTTSQSPMLTTKGTSKTFWLCYRPPATSTGNGALTVGIVGGTPEKITIPVGNTDVFTRGATLNRFGIINWGDDQGAAETVNLDDLRYTVAPGDIGPAAQCP
jgi:hypothetical protein